MSTPAHRAAVAFLRGGLIAVVSVALAPPLGALASALHAPQWVAAAARLAVPVAGFAIGGAVGGDALAVGTRGAAGFGWGGAAAGLVLALASAPLQGLTGFENPWVVVPYETGTSMIAFGVMGAVGSLVLHRGRSLRVTVAFLAGGAAGGLTGVLPYAVQLCGSVRAEVSTFLTLACSIGSVVVPFVVGGASAARVWEGE